MNKNLHEILSEIDIKVAIKMLNHFLDDKDIKKDLTLLFSRYRNIEKDYYLIGMINRRDAVIEINSIRKAFFEVIEDIPHDLNLNSVIIREIENRKNSIGKKKKFFDRGSRGIQSSFLKTTFKTVSNEQDMLNSGRYNIVIVGRSGVGKSELVNYLFNKENIALTGVGSPVTKKGFHKKKFIINGIPTTLYDSWGLEVGKTDEWLSELNNELRKRDIDKPASEWFHTVLYCVAASSSRIEDFELEIISKFVNSKYRVVVVFTKSDLVESSDIRHLIKAIADNVEGDVVFTEVCSVEKKLRSGKTEKFGADKLYSIINTGFWNSITMRLPDRCVNILIRIINTWEEQQYSFIKKFTNNFNIDKIYPELEKNSIELIDNLESEQCRQVLFIEVDKTINMYESFSKMLNFNTELNDNFFEFEMKKIEEFDYQTEKRNDVIGAIFFIGIPLLFNGPKDGNIRIMERKIQDFSTNLKKDILRLKPAIQQILQRMLESID